MLKFQIPRGIDTEFQLQAIENEIDLLWRSINDFSAEQKYEVPQICLCDVPYTGAHRTDCPFKGRK